MGRSPLAQLLPPAEVGHAVVAGFLGLELLASLDGDRAAALALFDRARSLARVLDVTGGRCCRDGKETARHDSAA